MCKIYKNWLEMAWLETFNSDMQRDALTVPAIFLKCSDTETFLLAQNAMIIGGNLHFMTW